MSAPAKTGDGQASPSDVSAESSAWAGPRSSVRFVVTGFGPFRGVPDNPTSVLIGRLRDGGDRVGSLGGTRVFETSAEHVRETLDAIYGGLKSSEGSGEGIGESGGKGSVGATGAKKMILLHLGVNYRGRQFQLEECAYNDATFRVPDERGYQPDRQCVLEDEDQTEPREWGRCLTTSLDVCQLCSDLQKTEESVVASRDPGRFVCNYTYCLSLDRCYTANKDSNCQYHALFVHVPPFDVITEKRQLDFVLNLMEAIERQCAAM
ncbi:hypothetical protein ACHAWF_013706 [Thalassiosira exigua]